MGPYLTLSENDIRTNASVANVSVAVTDADGGTFALVFNNLSTATEAVVYVDVVTASTLPPGYLLELVANTVYFSLGAGFAEARQYSLDNITVEVETHEPEINITLVNTSLSRPAVGVDEHLPIAIGESALLAVNVSLVPGVSPTNITVWLPLDLLVLDVACRLDGDVTPQYDVADVLASWDPDANTTNDNDTQVLRFDFGDVAVNSSFETGIVLELLLRVADEPHLETGTVLAVTAENNFSAGVIAGLYELEVVEPIVVVSDYIATGPTTEVQACDVVNYTFTIEHHSSSTSDRSEEHTSELQSHV